MIPDMWTFTAILVTVAVIIGPTLLLVYYSRGQK